ncbi:MULTISPECIES: glucosamine-6-phosphate deaminase NagB-II [Alteromonadaceae]|uniref:glucosamine-6-phosphate deaminase NagB-II n=1 Tax=Alteromonadaceae TaxID=72275 RepID=UPI001C09B65D|nr:MULTISPECIES: SIS domain-containing protein [Aliiglaciecola]MBU2878243.1 SIS domain-containing protein [Aliiglaciecola lipolytica]MDO6711846.1 SIS domain-containing protein [Aliiglaciecola sp. 2_MG-2023]MDO6752980.1 SIS domain-containing protein [Aliiglaciecola sp. 1_MG-2023]
MTQTIMEKEARQTPKVIREQIQKNQKTVTNIANKLHQFKPKMVMIIGRGSSDHAGVFAKYLIEIEAQIPTFAAAPSVSSVYNKQLVLDNALVIVISQSGRSPDILAQAKMAKKGGAYCIALVNDESSPLKDIVDDVLPLNAGKEESVAATKSYLSTLSALLHLVATWTNNQGLLDSLNQLPSLLEAIIDSPSQLAPTDVDNVNNLVVLGRGLGFAVSKEIALKLKEVCSIHAEAFSSAEFLHGPITLIEQGLAILDCLVLDESEASHIEQINEVKRRGAQVLHLHQSKLAAHPRIAPLLVLQRFYIDVAKLSTHRGLNPDVPLGLNKVTKTL